MNLRIFLYAYLTIAVSSPTHAGNFVLNGRIAGMNARYLYLNYLPGDGKMGVLDSARVTDGQFQFQGSVAEPSLAHLFTKNPFAPGFRDSGVKDVDFYLDKGNLSVTLEYPAFTIERFAGSATESEREALQRSKQPLQRQHDSAANLLRKNQGDNSLKALVDNIEKEELEIDSLYIAEHPNSFLAADILSGYKSYEINFPSLATLYQRFPEWIKKTSPGQKIYAEIQKEKAVYPGVSAYLFSCLTSQGDTFRLDAYRGRKYVLLDFWASWCGPCRQVTPVLKTWLRPYTDSIEVVSIACWDKDADWRKAIGQDKMDWPQINDSTPNLANPNGLAISTLYHINLVPSWILIDKNGNVVDKFGGWYNAKRLFVLRTDLKEIFKR